MAGRVFSRADICKGPEVGRKELSEFEEVKEARRGKGKLGKMKPLLAT